MPGLLAEKMGMTQIFGPLGQWIPATVLKAGPCTVVVTKDKDRDGYQAVQLAYHEIDEKRLNKPLKGHFLKKKLKPHRILKEMRTAHPEAYAPGDLLNVGYLAVGDAVDVIGISKGKGFQGVMKRHHFAGGRASHGCSVSHRSPGAIGQRTYPGKVFKGKRMAGRMGGERVTLQNLKVVAIEKDANLVLVKGAVPGPNHGFLEIHPCTHDFEKRFKESKDKK